MTKTDDSYTVPGGIPAPADDGAADGLPPIDKVFYPAFPAGTRRRL